MSVITDVINTVRTLRAAVTVPIFLDLGSSRTRIILQKKSVYDEPTCCLYVPSSQHVLEVGTMALQATGALPDHVDLVKPIQKGRLTHRFITHVYLSAVLKKVLTKANRTILLSAWGACGIPSSLSPVEKNTLKKVLQQSGLGGLRLVPKVDAVFHLLMHNRAIKGTVGIIDMGSEVTEVALFHHGKKVIAQTLPFGGSYFSHHIRDVIRSQHEATISDEVVEYIKQQHRGVPFWTKNGEKVTEFKIPIRVKSMKSQVPQTLYVSNVIFHAGFLQLTKDFMQELQRIFGEVNDDVMTTVIENGLYITGGGSLVPGIIDAIEDHFKSPILPVFSAQTDVVQGLALSQVKESL